MSDKTWLKKIIPKINRNVQSSSVPEGLWRKCPKCGAFLYRPELEAANNVCPKCDHHMRISAKLRLESFLDEGTMNELATELAPKDALKFKDLKKYKDRISAAQKASEQKDAMVAASGQLKGHQVVACAFEFNFMGGSMGSVVGEKFVASVDKAIALHAPLICFSASGGARMQEALFSLMQMARTSAAIEKLKKQKLPFISVMTDPVYGGVTASLAMLGDVNLAEPNALIGFAGPRVIEQTVRQKLPEGFQRSEFLLEHGTLDDIVHRSKMRDKTFSIASKLMKWQLSA